MCLDKITQSFESRSEFHSLFPFEPAASHFPTTIVDSEGAKIRLAQSWINDCCEHVACRAMDDRNGVDECSARVRDVS